MISCIIQTYFGSRFSVAASAESAAADRTWRGAITRRRPSFALIRRGGQGATTKQGASQRAILTTERFRVAQVALIKFHVFPRQIARVKHGIVPAGIQENVQIEFRL